VPEAFDHVLLSCVNVAFLSSDALHAKNAYSYSSRPSKETGHAPPADLEASGGYNGREQPYSQSSARKTALL
jgi:hypothetical protein